MKKAKIASMSRLNILFPREGGATYFFILPDEIGEGRDEVQKI